MWIDPIVEEVRAARQQIAEQCGYDFGRMLEREREGLRSWSGKVVTKDELDAERRARALVSASTPVGGEMRSSGL
jgi:hypothetical protein